MTPLEGHAPVGTHAVAANDTASDGESEHLGYPVPGRPNLSVNFASSRLART